MVIFAHKVPALSVDCIFLDKGLKAFFFEYLDDLILIKIFFYVDGLAETLFSIGRVQNNRKNEERFVR